MENALPIDRYSPYARRIHARQTHPKKENVPDERYRIAFQGSMPTVAPSSYSGTPQQLETHGEPYATDITFSLELLYQGQAIAYKALPHLGVLPDSEAHVAATWQHVMQSISSEYEDFCATLALQDPAWSAYPLPPLRSAGKSSYDRAYGYRFVRVYQDFSFYAGTSLAPQPQHVKSFLTQFSDWLTTLSPLIDPAHEYSFHITQLTIGESISVHRSRTFRTRPPKPSTL